MLAQALVVARKELLDGLRDVRALISSFFYCLMGPGVVFMVSFATAGKNQSAVLTGMASVFILVSAFVGGMNVAMDVLSGERERRSLLPLLLNGVARRDVIVGKWLATACFSMAGLAVTMAGFALVLDAAHVRPAGGISDTVLILTAGLIPLALFAAAVELCISTVCRTLKEAHTYLSMLVFAPMAVGMGAVFFPNATRGWGRLLPVAGQQWQMDDWVRGGVPLVDSLALAAITVAMTAAVLRVSAKLLERDDVVYGS